PSLLSVCVSYEFFFFSSRRRHTRSKRDWSSDVCSSDLFLLGGGLNMGGGTAFGHQPTACGSADIFWGNAGKLVGKLFAEIPRYVGHGIGAELHGLAKYRILLVNVVGKHLRTHALKLCCAGRFVC